MGLVGGIGLALLREYMDNTVKNPDDIETLARLPPWRWFPRSSMATGMAGAACSKLLKGP